MVLYLGCARAHGLKYILISSDSFEYTLSLYMGFNQVYTYPTYTIGIVDI